MTPLHVSFLVAGIRFAPLFSLLFLGDRADSWSAKRIVIYTEFAAALCSLGIYLLWPHVTELFWFFSFVCICRAAAVSLQTGSRNRILKYASDQTSRTDARLAIWLNKVTHGAILISAVLSLFLVAGHYFQFAVVIDCLSFILCGFLTLTVPDVAVERQIRSSLKQIFINLYSLPSNVALADLALALVMAGLNMYIFRLSNGDPQMTSILFIAYGLAIWLSGYALRIGFIEQQNFLVWILLGLSYFTTSLFIGSFVRVGLFFLINIFYWHLFHKHSAVIQKESPAEKIGSITIARNIQMLTVLFSGEWVVGLISAHLSVGNESLIRGSIAIAFALLLGARLR
jgi:hypothetical protein